MSTGTDSFSREILEYGEIDSTNEEMSRLIGSGNLDEGTVIRAGFQTAGKGHGGNSWSSDRDRNLLISLFLKPVFLPPGLAFDLSRITSLSIVEVLDRQSINAVIKWPNDILVGLRKIAGILIENSIAGIRIGYSIIGVGLNVNQEKFETVTPAPTSMVLEKGCHFYMNLVLEDFRSALEKWYRLLQAGDRDPVTKAYRDRLYLLDRTAKFAGGGRVFKGKILGVLPDGELEVKQEGGAVHRYAFKEIEFLGEWD
jgi:BirA family biotin operon repressor/biotin-[acetyl-CoA-carboxylase] ligase